MFNSRFYKRSPVLVQDLLLTGRGLLYNFLRRGRAFKKMLFELESMERLEPGKIRERQNKRLRPLVRHAYENVPYYNRLFKRIGIRPSDIEDIDDLKKLPFLTKEDLRRAPEDFLAGNINRLFISKNFTSGTSGKPLKLYRDMASINLESAIMWRQRRWAGINFSDRIAVLREEEIVAFDVKTPPFWRYSVPEKKMILSAYHMKKENACHYAKAIRDFRPALIEAQPSSLYILSRFIKDGGVVEGFSSVKAIFTSSEMLLDKHREVIEEVFGAPIYDFYGNAERVAAIGMCERKNYHILEDYGIAEFLPVKGETDRAEIVGTNLYNYAMPLLRYRTGDLVRLSGTADCGCGRTFKVIKKIEGRLADFLVSGDGRIAIDACYLTLKGVENIVQSQIIQEDADTIRIKFAPAGKFSDKDGDKIINNVKAYMGKDVRVLLEEDRGLVNNKSAKFRPFISKVREKAGL